LSRKEENVAVTFPPKKRQRKSVTVDDSNVAPALSDKVTTVVSFLLIPSSIGAFSRDK